MYHTLIAINYTDHVLQTEKNESAQLSE